MSLLVRWSKSAWLLISNFLMVVFFGSLLLLMFFAAPLEWLVESYNLLQIRSVAVGQIVKNEVIENADGNKHPHVKYTFSVGTKQFESTRIGPSWYFSRGHNSDEHRATSSLRPGQPMKVFYDAADPSNCALFYGWHKWIVGWTLIVWGNMFAGSVNKYQVLIRGRVVYGGGLIFLGPTWVLCEEIHYHAVAYLAAVAVVWVWPGLFERKGRAKRTNDGTSLAVG